jgi:hypothetical protein
MKKIICSFILASCCSLGIQAQLADGFYHIKNATTNRYISINDTDPQNYPVSQSGDVNMGGIRTYINYDSVAVSPSCVIFVRNLPEGGYDLAAQGSSLYTMANKKLAINITPSGGGYKISGTANGITKILADGSASQNDSWLMNRLTETQNWYFIPINTSNEYIALRPDVKTADGAYYGTIFAGFNFRLASPGMAAFYVSNAGGTGFTMNLIEDEVIPANTPVIIRCNSANLEDNKIEPVIGGNTFDHVNWLGGVYCSIDVTKHHNYTLFDRVTMRVLGLSDKGELAFVSKPGEGRLYKDQFLMANRAYLKVNAGDADVMIHGKYDPQAINSVKSDDESSTGIYTLTGVRLPDGVTPRAGIYVKNGKKVIIK